MGDHHYSKRRSGKNLALLGCFSISVEAPHEILGSAVGEATKKLLISRRYRPSYSQLLALLLLWDPFSFFLTTYGSVSLAFWSGDRWEVSQSANQPSNQALTHWLGHFLWLIQERRGHKSSQFTKWSHLLSKVAEFVDVGRVFSHIVRGVSKVFIVDGKRFPLS